MSELTNDVNQNELLQKKTFRNDPDRDAVRQKHLEE